MSHFMAAGLWKLYHNLSSMAVQLTHCNIVRMNLHIHVYTTNQKQYILKI